jgi:hypothetical protein
MTSPAPLAGKLADLSSHWGARIAVVPPEKARFSYGLLGQIGLFTVFAIVLASALLLAVRKDCILREDENRYAEAVRTFEAPLFASAANFERCRLDRLSIQMDDQRIMGPAISAALLGLIGMIGTLRLASRRKRFYTGLNDQRPYALYLRPFKVDLASDGAGDVRGEAETAAVAAFWAHGPSIALDNVDEPGVANGAVRIKTDSAIWRDVVVDLGRDAAVVFLDATSVTVSLREEIDLVFAKDALTPNAVIFVLGDKDQRRAVADLLVKLGQQAGLASGAIDPDQPPVLFYRTRTMLASTPSAKRTAQAGDLDRLLKSPDAQTFFANLFRPAQ